MCCDHPDAGQTTAGWTATAPVRLLAAALLAGVCWQLGSPLRAEDWPAFRGPRGNGISEEAEAQTPLRWSASEHIRWKAPLPRPGNGSPIVSAGKVFVTSAEDPKGLRRSLYCFDRRSGQQLWVQTVDFNQEMPTHQTNPYCGSTPASDGQRVVVWHGSAGLHCYSHEGQVLWSRQLGEFRHMWGYGTSPILVGDRVILHSGPGKRVFVGCYELASGKTLWETEEPLEGDGERNAAGHYLGSWSTPVLARVQGRDQLICSMPTRVVAYDPLNGNLLWSCDGLRGERGDLAYSSPMIHDQLCVAIGGFNGPGLALKLGGTGNLTESHRLWRNKSNPQSIGTGVFLGQHVYRVNANRPGLVQCLDPATGEALWASPARTGAGWGSMVAVGKRLYVTNQDGTTFVFAASPDACELLAENPLGENSNSTPAVSDGQIFIRTMQHLFCIGN